MTKAESQPTGVMLVGHGTRDEMGTRQFFQLGEQLSALLSPVPLESCLLEFQHPTISQAWQALVQRGVRHIHVAPLLLFAAGHAKQDIPDALRQCQMGPPNVTFDLARPISRHPSLVALVLKRINETVRKHRIEPTDSALVMVGRGNRDPAPADMRVLTEVVAYRLSFAQVVTAFYAMAQPQLPAMLDQLALTKRFKTIVVQPHLLFAGRLYQAIIDQVADASSRHPHVHFVTTDYLGPEPEIAQSISGRVRQI